MFQFGGLEASFGGAKTPKRPPWERDWYHIFRYVFLYKELVVCCVTPGGCGHGGY